MRSPVLALYRAAVTALTPFAGLYLDHRVRAGKEDRARLAERWGHAPRPRPAGRLVWLHAASIGESGVAMQIAEALAAREPNLSFLISTGTKTSAELVARRALPRTTHVYAPLDKPAATRRFIAHWRPDLSVFVEGEAWPNLIFAARASGAPLAMVNARMSPATIARWRRWEKAGAQVFSAFDLILAADQRTADGLNLIAPRLVRSVGNLKLAAPAPHVDETARARAATQIGARPVWLAASTHPGEDEILIDAHNRLRERLPDALLLLAPRHPNRGEAIAALAGNAPRRAQGAPIGPESVHVLDTLGELGVFFALAPVAFIAGSLLPKYKGHNAAEAVKLGAAVVAGPHVESFQGLYNDLAAAHGLDVAADAPSIADAVHRLLTDNAARQASVTAAQEVVAHGSAGLDETVAALMTLMRFPAAPPKAANASA